jgi:uncharacterized membrane protein YdjX (TVP38/TMEM64 family)
METSGNLRRSLRAAAAAGIGLAVLYALGTFLLCGIFEEAAWCRAWPHLSLQHIERYVRSAGPWGVAVSIGLMVIHSFVPFPAEFIAVANGMLYGHFWGVVITWSGAMLGAFLAFGLARKLGRPYVERMLKYGNLRTMEQWFDRHGGGAVFISRFIPVISFNLINYVAGLTGISWWTFAWSTGLGILPLTVLMVYMGSRVSVMPWRDWALLLAAGLVLWLLGHLLRRRLWGAREKKTRPVP